MKPLHKIIDSKNTRVALQHIQVKNGFVYATDAHQLCKIPVAEVFGEGVVADDEEFYIHADEWRTAKLDKAVTINRDGMLFESLDRKGKTLGRAKALTELPDGLKYPNCESVIPTNDTVFQLCINAGELKALADVLGVNNVKVEVDAIGKERAFRVKTTQENSKAFGITMPIIGYVPEYFGDNKDNPAPVDKESDTYERLEAELTETADELRDANKRIRELELENQSLESKISELENELDETKEERDELGVKSLDTGSGTTANGHAFRYYTENPVDAQIVEAFAECLADIPPADMLENLRLMKEYKILM